MRPTRDEYFAKMARLVAERSTCLRRNVGAVAVNARGHVLSTGYNGVAAGMAHCNDHDQFHETGFPHACSAAHAPSGTSLDGCHAIHAEQNMLLQCKDPWDIETVYCTASPCITCVKLLLNTSCQRIVFLDEYPHPDARDLWVSIRGSNSWVKHGELEV